MLAILSLILAVAAVAINLGWLLLPTGHWPGISLGLAAAVAGVIEIRSTSPGLGPGPGGRKTTKMLAWTGACLGLLSALIGIAIYLGWGIAAGRVG
jgi:hypothetical protein